MRKLFKKGLAGLTAALCLVSVCPQLAQAATIQKIVGYRGDLNGDSEVSIADVVLYEQYLTGQTVLEDAHYGDMNGDEKLTAVDFSVLKNLLLTGKEPEPVYIEIEESLMEAPVKAIHPSLPSTGIDEILLFVIDTPDCKFESKYTADVVQDLVFGPEDKNSPYYPMESISAYYERASYGALNIVGTTYKYTAKKSVAEYYDDLDMLVEEVMSAFDAQIDYNKFDVNRDGTMDTMILAFADSDKWWPYSSGYYGYKKYDNVRAGNVLAGGWPMSDVAGFVSTWVHEMGHGMGLVDYYKYENFGNDQYGLNGDAGWLMMDDAFGDMCCFDKLMYGWYTESQVQKYTGGTQTFQLKSSQEAANCVMIPRYDNGGYLTEYILIEYASDTGNNTDGFKYSWWNYKMFDKGGIRILHCDAEVCEGYWGPEFKWGNYGKYYDTSNQKQRVLRLVNDNGGFFKTGDTVTRNTKGFQWYDANGYQTIDIGVTISIGALENGEYTITIAA